MVDTGCTVIYQKDGEAEPKIPAGLPEIVPTIGNPITSTVNFTGTPSGTPRSARSRRPESDDRQRRVD